MTVTCKSCTHRYDDAEQSTICPHERFLSLEDQNQKDLGISLIGKPVAFHHMPNSLMRVSSVGWNGMVTVDGISGEFAPHLFRVVENNPVCVDCGTYEPNPDNPNICIRCDRPYGVEV